ncbi:rRNA methylase [Candidatus Tenderia electrophaga]|jgi:tRNA (cytidine/uridine-2'-O-)-methyltransferase|uniref:tRNA (cytidine(34)-2'-O)-methyltransferase n=1 Tax=Candidatus Tenderia electrophaga TaxID=1748243 RepID=A0A0S2TAB3_9GAMM|nr:rRNA methylase [Candidatus Tenderia electrophaga]
MFHIALFQPEIPPNTGNVIRLCANTGSQLHLIHPLGFELNDRKLRRAGLDYHEFASVHTYPDLDALLHRLRPARVFAFSTHGRRCYSDPAYRPGDLLLFGPETRGLPPELRRQLAPEQVLRLPMKPNSRSLNLSNTVSIVLYEAWRQNGFALSKDSE